MSLTTGASLMATRADARGRLLAELAGQPARRGFAIAYDLLGNRAEAEEAVQEALARACEAIADLREPAAAPGWFLRIVTNQCLHVLRRRKLVRTLFGWLPGSGGDDAAEPDAVAARLHAAAEPAPSDALVDRERFAALVHKLDALPAKQRTAVVLRYGHDLPVGEIAELLGVELATAKTHLVRGLARLRDLMEDQR